MPAGKTSPQTSVCKDRGGASQRERAQQVRALERDEPTHLLLHDAREAHARRRVQAQRLVDARREVGERLDVVVLHDAGEPSRRKRRVELFAQLLVGVRVRDDVVHDGAARARGRVRGELEFGKVESERTHQDEFEVVSEPAMSCVRAAGEKRAVRCVPSRPEQ